MRHLGEHAAEADRSRFVGRRRELADLLHVLSLESDIRVVHVVGPAGIGKSALLREFARHAAERGVDVDHQDGAAPVRARGEGPKSDGPRLVVRDLGDLPEAILGRIRSRLLPRLSSETVLVTASRMAPGRSWYEDGWASVVTRLDLEHLGQDDSRDLLRVWGLTDPEQQTAAVARWQGHPLALVLAAQNGGHVDPTRLFERLVGEVPDVARLRTLAVAAMVKVGSPDLLGAVADVPDPLEDKHGCMRSPTSSRTSTVWSCTTSSQMRSSRCSSNGIRWGRASSGPGWPTTCRSGCSREMPRRSRNCST